MDAHLDTLSTKLYQVNTRVDHFARWQARLSGFVESPSPPLEASKTSEDDDNGDDGDDDDDSDDDDGVASSTDEIST